MSAIFIVGPSCNRTTVLLINEALENLMENFRFTFDEEMSLFAVKVRFTLGEATGGL